MGIQRSAAGHGKLPVRQLAILAACRFAEPIAFTSVFPYLPEMIESFGVDRTNVAKWAGITSAVFSLAQSVTAIGWGRASDYFGRKPMVILALFLTMVMSLVWGFSTSLPMAIVARAGSGACNGNVGIMRTMVAEMVPEKDLQPKAFSVLPLVWSVGSTLGPALGGFFAKPVDNFPGIFGHSKFFAKFPFALPNLIAGIFFTIGLFFAVFFLQETMEAKKDNPDFGRILGEKFLNCVRKKSEKSRMNLDLDDEASGALLETLSRTSTASMGDADWTPPRSKPLKPSQPPPGLKEVFTRQSSLTLLAYTILALHSVSFDQLLPVFLHHPVQAPDESNPHLSLKFSGGFGLGSGRIGTLFTVFGLCSGCIQFLIFPPVARRYGILNSYKLCTVTFPLVYFATPFPALIRNSMLQQIAMLAIMIVKSFCVVFAFPCVMILLTNSAPSLRVLGTLNGFATSLSAIGRAIGPALSGALFTWGVEYGYVIVPWWMLAIISAIGIIPVWYIEESDGFADKGGSDDEDEDDNVRDEPEGTQISPFLEAESAVTGNNSRLQLPGTSKAVDFADGAPLVRKRSRSPHTGVQG